MNALELLSQLDGVRQRGARWSALCPAHNDKSPSLSISEGERGLLLKCWAGCSVAEICASLGIGQRDLFFDAPLPRGHRPPPKPPRLDRVKLAFRYDLHALDLRLRAQRIREAGKHLEIFNLSDHELDRVLRHMAQAHGDVERAELFEQVADTLRARECGERNNYARQELVA